MQEEVLNLIKEGKSINCIQKQTGLAKSTIYHHYKKINGRKVKEIVFNFENEEDIGEFLGVFSGDGSFFLDKNWHYTIKICLGYYEGDYAERLYQKLTLWFNKKPRIYYFNHLGKPSFILLQYDSKKIYNLIKSYLSWEGKKTYTVRLKNLDLTKKDFNLAFLRGLIDTDGTYYKPKRRISFSTASKNLALQVNRIISTYTNFRLNIWVCKKSGYADLYTQALHGSEAHLLIKLINPTNPNKNIR